MAEIDNIIQPVAKICNRLVVFFQKVSCQIICEEHFPNRFTALIKSIEVEGECESDEHYSYTECLRSYVSRTTNCSICSCSIGRNSTEVKCTTDGLIKMLQTLNEIQMSTRIDSIKKTGCLPKCTKHHFKFEQTRIANAKWRKKWISSFYLSSRTTSYLNSVERYSYDIQVCLYIQIWTTNI